MKIVDRIDWEKMNGLIPVIIQNYFTKNVLMLGYMNKEALELSIEKNRVIFYSRSKKRLWEKGETSGNHLKVCRLSMDCDTDSLLVLVEPFGPTCHTGKISCYEYNSEIPSQVLSELQVIINERRNTLPEDSYTTSLFRAGMNKIAQKVGEEAVEVVVAALCENNNALINETADLLYHLLVLLSVRNISINEAYSCLVSRQKMPE